jgi:hypothetical protein
MSSEPHRSFEDGVSQLGELVRDFCIFVGRAVGMEGTDHLQ